jgi:hypothetical protein
MPPVLSAGSAINAPNPQGREARCFVGVRPCPDFNGYQGYAGGEREISIGGGCGAGSEDDRDSVRRDAGRGGSFGLWIEWCHFNVHDHRFLHDSASQASDRSPVESAHRFGAGADHRNRWQ